MQVFLQGNCTRYNVSAHSPCRHTCDPLNIFYQKGLGRIEKQTDSDSDSESESNFN
jgi:hypothetical protein